MSTSKVRRSESVKSFRSKIEGKLMVSKQMTYQHSSTYAKNSPNVTRVKQQSQFGNNKNNISQTREKHPTRINKLSTRISLPCQSCQALPIVATSTPSNTNFKKQKNCDETLDEITWGCDDSRSPMISDNGKFCDIENQGIDESFSSFCLQMKKNIDFQAEKDDDLDICLGQKEEGDSSLDKLSKGGMRQETKERETQFDKYYNRVHFSIKSDNVKKKTEKMKHKNRKLSREVSKGKTSTSRQLHRSQGLAHLNKINFSNVRKEMNVLGMKIIQEDRKTPTSMLGTKKLTKKPMISPRTLESVKISEVGSAQSDELFGGSDQQFQGNRSESSLVCKRDSWIWFSPEMRPSVEDFAARQRKFQSRDPRVAELAVEISRQEEMNRDIERAAESLIDSSSPSTCKLQNVPLRPACVSELLKGNCGAIKNRSGRNSRVTPYKVPEKKRVACSPNLETNLAFGGHDQNRFIERVPSQKISPMFDMAQLTKTSPDKQERNSFGMFTSSPKLDMSWRNNLEVRSKCQEPRISSSISSDKVRNSYFGLGSLCQPPYQYNSPAAKAIRQPLAPTRYSPFYDNTTLISSTQCSLCSTTSNPQVSAENISTDNYRLPAADWTYDSSQVNRPTKQNRTSRASMLVDLTGSHEDSVFHKGKSFRPHTRLTSPKKGRFKQVTPSAVTSSETTFSFPGSPANVPERGKDRQLHAQRTSWLSPAKNSDTTRRFPSQVIPNPSRGSLDTRSDSLKSSRKSPQMVFCTGDSDSESAQRDKSGAPEASYRQCLISKEVNTAVQRLLFDTERSSSSHSPSSKSKIRLVDVNEDDGCYPVDDQEKGTGNVSQVQKTSHIKVNFGQVSYINLHMNVNADRRGPGSDKLNAENLQNGNKSSQPTSVNLLLTDSQSSKRKIVSKSNIYTPDYYLGKRATLKRHEDSKKNDDVSRWKKTDVTWAKAVSLHLYSPQNISDKLSSTKQDLKKPIRQAMRRKPCLKHSAAQQCPEPQSSTTENCPATNECRSVPTDTISSNQAVTDETHEIDANLNKGLSVETSTTSIYYGIASQQSKKVTPCESLNIFPGAEVCPQKHTPRQSSSQPDNYLGLDYPVCRSPSPVRTSQSQSLPGVVTDLSKKEECIQTESRKLLLTGSTNNSSSNLIYSSDKSECSRKQSFPTQAAKFYFVTQAKPKTEQTCPKRKDFQYLGLAKNTNIDMFENPQTPFQSCSYVQPNLTDSNIQSKNSSDFIDFFNKESKNNSGFIDEFNKKSNNSSGFMVEFNKESKNSSGFIDMSNKESKHSSGFINVFKKGSISNQLSSDDITNTGSRRQREVESQGKSSTLDVKVGVGGSVECSQHQYRYIPNKTLMFNVDDNETLMQESTAGIICLSKMPQCSSKKHDVCTPLDKNENQWKQLYNMRDKKRVDILDKSRPLEAATFDRGQCSSLVVLTTSTQRNMSNPDSGYDESLSEKFILDYDLQLDTTTVHTDPAGSYLSNVITDKDDCDRKFESISTNDCDRKLGSTSTGDCDRKFGSISMNDCGGKLESVSTDDCDQKGESISFCSDVSPSSDFAQRSRVSSEWDSEQDTLPSLSDDACLSSNNLDLLSSWSPPRSSKGVQSKYPGVFIKDRANQVFEDEGFEKSADRAISPCLQENLCTKETFHERKSLSLKKCKKDNKEQPLSQNFYCDSNSTVVRNTTKCKVDTSVFPNLSCTKLANNRSTEHLEESPCGPDWKKKQSCYNQELQTSTHSNMTTSVSCSPKCSINETLSEGKASETYTFPMCNAKFFPLCLSTKIDKTKSSTPEVSSDLINQTNKNTSSSLSVKHKKQFKDFLEETNSRIRRDKLLEGSEKTKMDYSQNRKVVPKHACLKPRFHSDKSCVGKENLENTPAKSLSKEEQAPTQTNFNFSEHCTQKMETLDSDAKTQGNSVCKEHNKIKDNSWGSWLSDISSETSPTCQSDLAQSPMLPKHHAEILANDGKIKVYSAFGNQLTQIKGTSCISWQAETSLERSPSYQNDPAQSFMLSPTTDDDVAQTIMLPLTSSDEEDIENDSSPDKPNTHKLSDIYANVTETRKDLTSPVTITHKFNDVNTNIIATRKDLKSQMPNSPKLNSEGNANVTMTKDLKSPVLNTEKHKQPASHQTHAVYSTPVRFSQNVKVNSATPITSKVFITSRHMPFLDILKRF